MKMVPIIVYADGMDSHDDHALTDRQFHRLTTVERLLNSLDDVVGRYRTFAARVELAELFAEAVTAEVARHLDLARATLSRHPALHPHVSSPSGGSSLPPTIARTAVPPAIPTTATPTRAATAVSGASAAGRPC